MWYKQISSPLKNSIKKGSERQLLEAIIDNFEDVFFNNPDPALKSQFFLVGLVLLSKVYNAFVLSETPITCENFFPYFNIKESIKIENSELFFKNALLNSFLEKIAQASPRLNLSSLKNQLSIINIPLENKPAPLEVSHLDFSGLKSFFAKETRPGVFESFFENSLDSIGKKELLDKFLQTVYELFIEKFKSTHKWNVNEAAFISVLNNIIKTQQDKSSVVRPAFKLEIAAYVYLYHNFFKHYRAVKIYLQRVADKNSNDFNQLSSAMTKIGFSVTDELAQDEIVFLYNIKNIIDSTQHKLKNNAEENQQVKQIAYQIIDEAINYFQNKTAVNYHLFKRNSEMILQETKLTLVQAKFIEAINTLGEVHENKVKNKSEKFPKYLNKFANSIAQLKAVQPNHKKLAPLEKMANHLTEIKLTYQNKNIFHEKIKHIILSDAWENDLDNINHSFSNLIEELLSFLLEENKTTSNVNDKPLFSKEKNLLNELQIFEEKLAKLLSEKTKDETCHQANFLAIRLRSCIDKGLQYKNNEEVYQAMLFLGQKAINQFKNLTEQTIPAASKELFASLEEVEAALKLLSGDANTSPKFFQKQRSPAGLIPPAKTEIYYS